MNNRARRFAPWGLYLALAAALAAAGLFIVQREFNLYLQISLALVVVGIALFVLLDPDRVRRMLTGRQARYGSNSAILTVAFIGILVVANFLAARYPQRWDLTEDQNFTLAPETLQVLESLEQPVTAQAFFSPERDTTTAERLLDSFKYRGGENFDYEFIDPVENPVAAQEARITYDGTIVLRMGENSQIAEGVTEADLTGALVRLLNPEAQVVYFLTGHGEYNPDGAAERSYSTAKQVLESKNYTVKPLNLLADKTIPEDASLIIVAGPQQPVSAEEVATLQGFVDAGGALMVMEEPTLLTDFGEDSDPLAEYLQSTWGIILGNDLVVDVTSQQASVVAIGAEYASHEITQQLRNDGLVSLLPSARSLATESRDGRTVSLLVSTSPQSWAETDLEALSAQEAEVQPDEGVDTMGPVPVVVAGENLTSEARVVVFGDADLASNDYYNAYGNGDLFTNSVDWLAGQEQLISLTPKENTQRFIATPSTTVINLILLGSVFIVPGIVLVAGIAVFIQRRKRG